MNDTKEQFAKIYNEHLWGGESKSGPGSDPGLLQSYLTLLAGLMKEKRIKSVVDIGCGDWALARTVDWSSVTYLGVDVVPELINRLNATHGTDNIRFICADLVSDDLPHADLCVIKDVLQHLSNDSVKLFLRNLHKYFNYALITNDVIHKEQAGWRGLWKSTTMPVNSDIPNGGYRPLSLTEAPFNLPARRLVTIPLQFKREVFGHPGIVYETKEVLFWENSIGG